MHGPRQSAAIAYYVLLSLFPLVLVFASIAGLVLKDESLRNDLVSALADVLPLTEAGADDIASALRGVSGNAESVGLISLVALVWTSSGMMGAIRGSLDDIQGETAPRPFVRGKLVDLGMLVVTLVLLAASAGITVVTRIAKADLGDSFGLSRPFYEPLRVIVPVALGMALLIVILRWVPTAGPPIRDLWPAALVGSITLWALSAGFAAFVARFSRYNVVYGSIATVVVFLVFVYLAANLVLVTASFAREWGEIRDERPGPEPGPGVLSEVLAFLRSLVVRDDRPRTPPS